MPQFVRNFLATWSAVALSRNEHQAFPRQRYASEMARYGFTALRKRLPKGEGLQTYRIGYKNDRGVSARSKNGGMRKKLGAVRTVSTNFWTISY